MNRILIFLIVFLLSFPLNALENYTEGSDVNNQIINSNFKHSISSKINIYGEIHDVDLVLNDNLRKMGINDLLSVGTSDFSNSSVNRKKNVISGIRKLNGKIIPKDSVFSFNEAIGNMSEKEGFAKDYVIKGGQIVLEMGGGVCQVSTTIIRSALNAGLDIIYFRNHSLAIPYYKPYGLDAAIYAPDLDVKFKNNTPGDIYISAQVFGTKLAILFYGINDGRRVSFKGPYINQDIDVNNYDKLDYLASLNQSKSLDYKKFKVTYVRTVSYEGKTDIVNIFTSKY